MDHGEPHLQDFFTLFIKYTELHKLNIYNYIATPYPVPPPAPEKPYWNLGSKGAAEQI